MLGGIAFVLYPLLLPSSNSTYSSLTTVNALAPTYGLSVALRWWTAGLVFAVAYVAWLYRSIGMKVDADEQVHEL